MASCSTKEWVTTAPFLTLNVSVHSSTDTTTTLYWKLECILKSPPSSNTSPRPYEAYVNGELVTTEGAKVAIASKTGTISLGSGKVVVSRGSSDKTVSFKVIAYWEDLTWSGSKGGTREASGSITIPAKESSSGSSSGSSTPSMTYTIKYNANGGIGAPSNQPKASGSGARITTSEPTRTGYTFMGWSTSATGSVEYEASDWYYTDADLTLYAVWKATTYTIKYNANGGTGAPASQTKTYDEDIKIPSTIPARTDYEFVGWGVSATSTTVSFDPGDPYTANANATLYAIWEIAYVPPTVTNIYIERCDSTYNVSDTGTYAHVKFNWSSEYAISSIVIKWKSSAETEWTSINVTVSGTSGSVNKLIGDGKLDPDYTYTVVATVTDAKSKTPVTKTLTGTTFMLDFMDGNKGAAIGKAAENEGVLDIGFQTRLLGGILYPVLESGVDLNDVMIPNTYIITSGRTYSNIPESEVGAILEVVGASSRRQQFTVISKTAPRSYERSWYDDSWGEWKPSGGAAGIGDSGWITPVLESAFAVYSEDDRVEYRKYGQMVEVRGAVKPLGTLIGGTSNYLIFTLPSGFRPSYTVRTLCQGSGTSKWLMSIMSDGQVNLARYSDASGYAVTEIGAWLPFHITYLVD